MTVKMSSSIVKCMSPKARIWTKDTKRTNCLKCRTISWVWPTISCYRKKGKRPIHNSEITSAQAMTWCKRKIWTAMNIRTAGNSPSTWRNLTKRNSGQKLGEENGILTATQIQTRKWPIKSAQSKVTMSFRPVGIRRVWHLFSRDLRGGGPSSWRSKTRLKMTSPTLMEPTPVRRPWRSRRTAPASNSSSTCRSCKPTSKTPMGSSASTKPPNSKATRKKTPRTTARTRSTKTVTTAPIPDHAQKSYRTCASNKTRFSPEQTNHSSRRPIMWPASTVSIRRIRKIAITARRRLCQRANSTSRASIHFLKRKASRMNSLSLQILRISLSLSRTSKSTNNLVSHSRISGVPTEIRTNVWKSWIRQGLVNPWSLLPKKTLFNSISRIPVPIASRVMPNLNRELRNKAQGLAL